MTIAELINLIARRERPSFPPDAGVPPYVGVLSDALYTARPDRVIAVLSIRRRLPGPSIVPQLFTFARLTLCIFGH